MHTTCWHSYAAAGVREYGELQTCYCRFMLPAHCAAAAACFFGLVASSTRYTTPLKLMPLQI
jgi:hypothetical protein